MSVKETVDFFCPPVLRGTKRRIEASPLATRLIRGTFWSFAGTILSRSLGLLAAILVARIIGKVGMGEFGIVQSTVGMFSNFAGLGLGLAATKHVAEHRIANPARVGETIGLLSLISWGSGLLMTLVVLFLSPWLAQHTLAAPGLAPELQMGSLLLLFGVINGIQTGILSGFEAFKTVAQINVICGLANFPLMVCGAYFGGLRGTVCGLVASQALNCFLNFLAVRRQARAADAVITYRHAHKHKNLLWQFGLPAMLSGLISGPVNWGTGTLLVNQPGGYAEMGILNATNSWFQAVGFLPGLLGQVLLPILATYVAVKNRSGLNRALWLATLANFILVFPAILVCCVFSRHIMAFYGPGFADGWPVLVLTLLNAGILVIQAPITDRLVATARMWAYFLTHIVWASMFVTLAWLLVPSHGSTGLATARLVAYTINFASVLVLVWLSERSNPDLTPAAVT